AHELCYPSRAGQGDHRLSGGLIHRAHRSKPVASETGFPNPRNPCLMKDLASAALLPIAACLAAPGVAQQSASAQPSAPPVSMTPQVAAEFIAAVDKALVDVAVEYARISWVNATYRHDDTDALAARYGSLGTEKSVEYALGAAKYAQVRGLEPVVARKLDIL